MKYIDKPFIDDATIVNDLENRLFTDANLRAQQKNLVLQQYLSYRNSAGNPHVTLPLNLPDAISENFKTAYKNEWKKVGFIDQIRNNLSINQCPLCGNMGTHQVDHFLPQVDYSELSILSENLVPICECNGIKNDYYKSAAVSERFLHPYFDQILNERLLLLKFAGVAASSQTPSFSIAVNLASTHPDFNRISYQISKLILREKFLNYMGNLWSQLINKPESQLFKHWQRNAGKSIDDLKLALDIAIEHYDGHHGTKNNWHSVFYYGVLKDTIALNHIYQKIL
jgi:hypothetical protein